MATDKLINHSQGESIITNLGTIATNLQNVTAISPAKFGMGYAVCDTAAGTAAKTANIANYVLTEGALVTVKFTNANTASNATLNLNNTGAKPILYKGSALTTDIISAGDICTFIYSTANSGSYNIINVDALSGAGAGTVKSVGAEGGLTTDQTSGAAISTTGNVKLNLKSNTAFTATAPDPVEIENKIYPVALDASGHPAVSVPGTTYTEGDGIDITNNVIKNTGVTAVTASDSSTGTNGTISVTTNGTAAEVAVKGLNNAAYKDVSTSIPATGAADTKVATEKAVADSISDKAIGTSSSTTAAITTFAGTDGKTLADSAVTIAKNATGVTDDDTKVPTSKAVKTYVDATATGISRYIGTITSASQLSTTAKKGDFYIVSTAWTGVHAGDEIIAEKDNPTAAIDGTNWTLLHNEADTNTTYTFAEGTTNGKFTVTPSDTGTAQSVTVHGLAASAYRDVDTTPTASSTKLVESGGVASALNSKQDTLTFDGTYNASTNKAATVSTVTNAINALDVSEVSVGSTKTINKISQADGKISVTTTDIRSASTSQTGIVQLNDAINNTSTTQAATANAVKKVNDKVTTCETNIWYAINNGMANALVVPNQTQTSGSLSVVVEDGIVKVTGPSVASANFVLAEHIVLKAGTYYFSGGINGQSDSNYLKLSKQSDDSLIVKSYDSTKTQFTLSSDIECKLTVYCQGSNLNQTYYPMVSLFSDIEFKHTKQNYDLTRLESEDRASLAEVVDSGAKNLIDSPTVTVAGITFTADSDHYITASPNNSDPREYTYANYQWKTHLKKGNYVLAIDIKTATSGNSAIVALLNSSSTIVATINNNQLVNKTGIVYSEFTVTTEGDYGVIMKCYAMVARLMICTKAAFGVSNKFVPYRPDYDTLIKQSTYTTSTTNTSISNLLYDAAKAVGFSNPAATTKSFFVSIFTETSNECLFLYGVYKHGVIGYAVSTANKGITFEGAINNLGTIGWTGGTAPYHVQVRFF